MLPSQFAIAATHIILYVGTRISIPQGECLVECLVSTDIDILNASNEPAFVISNRKKVIDLRLGNDMVGNWSTIGMYVMRSVCQKTDTYYFKWVTWKLQGLQFATPREPMGNPIRKTWKANVGVVPRVIHSVWGVELAVDVVQEAIISFYLQNCPTRVALSPRMVPWWS